LNRDRLADILDRADKEKLIAGINDLSSDEKETLKNLTKAQRILFGEMEIQPSDNSLLVTLMINNLESSVQETTRLFEIPSGEYETHRKREPYIIKGIEETLLGKKRGSEPPAPDEEDRKRQENDKDKPVVQHPIDINWIGIYGRLAWVSTASDGSTWGVNSAGMIFRWNGNEFTQTTDGRLAQISVGNSRDVWGVNSANEIFRWTGNTWVKVHGLLKHISVGSDGTVWGVNAQDEIFSWNGNTFIKADGLLSQISVGNSQNIWGVNKSNEIFRREGRTWKKVVGALKQVSAGADGTVWGINSKNEIFEWNSQGFIPRNGLLNQISVGNAKYIWGTNDQGKIFQKGN